MGSRHDMGGRLPASAQSGLGHEVPGGAPGGPPPEPAAAEGGAEVLDLTDVNLAAALTAALTDAADRHHVSLTPAELQRLLHPAPTDK